MTKGEAGHGQVRGWTFPELSLGGKLLKKELMRICRHRYWCCGGVEVDCSFTKKFFVLQ